MPSVDGIAFGGMVMGRTWAAFVVIMTALVLSGCAKFESKKPDPTQIIFISNDESIRAAAVPPSVQALPLPLVDNDPLQNAPASSSVPDVVTDGDNTANTAAPMTVGVVEEGNLADAPFNASAYLTFRQGGVGYRCSAQVIGPNKDVLLTAGHCVFEEASNRWNSDFSTFTRYRDGGFAQFIDWSCAAVFSGWANRNFAQDYAFIKLVHPSDVSLGMRLGLPYSQFRSMGYPGNQYGGQRLAVVEGTKGGTAGQIASMNSNPFNGGSSGGAWFVDRYAIGLNSFGYKNNPNTMYGPVFDGNTQKLYEFVSGNCASVTPAALGSYRASETSSADTTVIEIDTTPVASGPQLVSSEGKSCPCPGSGTVNLTNDSANDYVVTLRSRDFGGPDREPIGDHTRTVLVRGETTVPLGCSGGDETQSNCVIATDWELLTSRRLVEYADAAGQTTFATAGSDFCTNQCINNPNGGYCYALGASGSSIVQSLSGFVGDTVKDAPAGSTTATVADMVTAFGGDPATVEDPCSRSDFYRTTEGVANEGVDCRVTSPEIGGSAPQLRISMRAPTQARALVPAGATKVPTFVNQSHAPSIEFAGVPEKDVLNTEYGGMVTSLTTVGKTLVISTENGCLSGEIKP